jgi:hypothetical protein
MQCASSEISARSPALVELVDVGISPNRCSRDRGVEGRHGHRLRRRVGGRPVEVAPARGWPLSILDHQRCAGL